MIVTSISSADNSFTSRFLGSYNSNVSTTGFTTNIMMTSGTQMSNPGHINRVPAEVSLNKFSDGTVAMMYQNNRLSGDSEVTLWRNTLGNCEGTWIQYPAFYIDPSASLGDWMLMENGFPCVFVISEDNDLLFYRSNTKYGTNGGWEDSIISPHVVGNIHRYPSMIVGTDGLIHLIVTFSSGDLSSNTLLVYNSVDSIGTSWDTVNLSPNSISGDIINLLNGNLGVFYKDLSDSSLHFIISSDGGSTWTNDSVVTTEDVDISTVRGHVLHSYYPTVSYRITGSNGHYLASDNSFEGTGPWTVHIVDPTTVSSSTIGKSSFIDFNNYNVGILYPHGSGGARVAIASSNDLDSWDIKTIDLTPTSGTTPSSMMTSNGYPIGVYTNYNGIDTDLTFFRSAAKDDVIIDGNTPFTVSWIAF